ncbi:MAG: hypothetical protein AAB914_03995 [Patescibacteria group bacterium]
MASSIALVGFVNTEEILADTIKQQTPEVIVDGYELFPNEAFGRLVDNRYVLYGVDNDGEFGLHNMDRLDALTKMGYSAINLGPDTAALVAGEKLDNANIDYIGPRGNELEIEIDKTKIVDIFPDKTKVLPPTKILENSDMKEVQSTIDEFGGNVVFKFVGEYSDYYPDSEYRRVRLLNEFDSSSELERFVSSSIESSGKVVIQKFIEGQEFSFTCLVDDNGSIFSLGENIFYKNRHENNKGPLCDGTGSISINNTLPNLLSTADIDHIKNDIVTPYVDNLGDQFGRSPKTFLNVDLIKGKDGRVYLLEVNNRQPGGHTMSTLLSGLDTPLADVLQATQEGRLDEIEARYKTGASVVVTAFPEISPNDFEKDEDRPVVVVPKLKDSDEVRIYTGWVDLLKEDKDTATVQSNLTATLLFVSHDASIKKARENVYKRISQVVSSGLAYRTDIGQEHTE